MRTMVTGTRDDVKMQIDQRGLVTKDDKITKGKQRAGQRQTSRAKKVGHVLIIWC